MVKLFKNGLFAAMSLGIVSCGSGEANKQEQGNKSLIVYYSQTGVTKTVAEEIQAQTGADIEKIEAVVPYDGDFMATVERCKKELAESIYPEIKPLQKSIADYDTIFIGYPVWCGTYAPPVATLLKDSAFGGKTIIPFCTFGSGGLETSVNDMEKALPNATVCGNLGYGVREIFVKDTSLIDLKEEVRVFLCNTNPNCTAEQTERYAEHQPVTENEIGIFNEACSGYQFPLGTPVSFAKNEIATVCPEKYEFKVNAKNLQGEDVENTIYINRINDKWMFTKVVR